MAASPSNAEQLYELVCSLQSEQQSTQLELRATQQRSESLKEEIEVHRATIKEERCKREYLLEKLKTLRLAARCQRAEESGADQAAQDAQSDLRTERGKFLHVCRRRAQAEAITAWPTEVENPSVSASPSTDSSLNSNTRLTDEACASLCSSADLYSLLSTLCEKLRTCLNVVDKAVESRINSKEEGVIGAAELLAKNSQQPHQLCEINRDNFESQGNEPCARLEHEPSLFPPEKRASNALSGPSTQPYQAVKKHIEFAPESNFHRVTPVPATNANRSMSRFVSGRPSYATNSNKMSNSGDKATGIEKEFPIHVSVASADKPRSAMKFIVRVGSRSSTLLAEAAALGAKRCRSMELMTAATTTTISTRSSTETVNEALNSPRRPAADPHFDNDANVPYSPEEKNVPVVIEDAATTRGTGHAAGNRENDAARFLPSQGLPISGPRLSGSASAGPRRTVWTWTHSAPKEKQPSHQ